jgi:hypothetical protein
MTLGNGELTSAITNSCHYVGPKDSDKEGSSAFMIASRLSPLNLCIAIDQLSENKGLRHLSYLGSCQRKMYVGTSTCEPVYQYIFLSISSLK